MKRIIQKRLTEILEGNISFTTIEVLKNPQNNSGSFSTNIALKHSKDNNMNPRELAEKIVSLISANDLFRNIEIAGPGFINFDVSETLIEKTLENILNNDIKISYSNKKINYEYISANPTGLLHIGHARNAIVGDSSIRIARAVGCDVNSEYYINDYGNQINDLAEAVFYHYAKNNDIETNLTPAYNGPEILDVANTLENKYDNPEELKELLVEHFLKEIKLTLSNLNISEINQWTSEKELFTKGKVKECLETILNTEYSYEEEGAKWIKTTELGDDKDRVLVKADGNYTYLVGDIANHVEKYENNYDQYINLWGMDHHGYEARVKASLKILGKDPELLDVDYISMVKLLNDGELVKMSKRSGNSLTINDVLGYIDVNIFRFFILSRNKEQSLDIDLKQIQEQDNSNPYFYSSYAYARANSILAKSTESEISMKSMTSNDSEFIDLLLDFEDRVISAFEDREPSQIVNFIKEVTSNFHSYYGSERIISENTEQQLNKIAIVKIFINIIDYLTEIIGIKFMKIM